MKFLATLTLAIVAISISGCSSLSTSERSAWSVFGRKAAADAEAVTLQKLAE